MEKKYKAKTNRNIDKSSKKKSTVSLNEGTEWDCQLDYIVKVILLCSLSKPRDLNK